MLGTLLGLIIAQEVANRVENCAVRLATDEFSVVRLYMDQVEADDEVVHLARRGEDKALGKLIKMDPLRSSMDLSNQVLLLHPGLWLLG